MKQKSTDVLYYANSASVTKNDIKNALINVGVQKGDVIMVHSDIKSFGRLATSDRDFLLQNLVDAIKESVGNNGTIIMPTFTYNFFKSKPYDTTNSKSAVGVLTEYFRKQPDVSRTLHPTHCVAIFGRRKNEILSVGKGTFDRDSIFGKLHKINCKFIFLGAPFRICTFIHYIENMHKVPYRYMKKFRGRIIADGKEYEDEFLVYCKYFFFFNTMLGLENHLLKKGMLKEVKVGYGIISMIEANHLFDEGFKLLDKDIYFLVKNEPFIFNLFNKIIYPFLIYLPWPFRIINNLVLRFTDN